MNKKQFQPHPWQAISLLLALSFSIISCSVSEKKNEKTGVTPAETPTLVLDTANSTTSKVDSSPIWYKGTFGTVSPNGKWLVVDQNEYVGKQIPENVRQDIRVKNLTTNSEWFHLFPPEKMPLRRNVVFSPDSSKLAVFDRSGGPKVWIFSTSNWNEYQLIQLEHVWYDNIIWRFDSKAFAVFQQDNANNIVYLYTLAGNKKALLTMQDIYPTANELDPHAAAYHIGPTWSPTGKYMAYLSLTPDNISNLWLSKLWLVDTSTNKSSMVYESKGWWGEPIWSPDGTKILFVMESFLQVFDVSTSKMSVFTITDHPFVLDDGVSTGYTPIKSAIWDLDSKNVVVQVWDASNGANDPNSPVSGGLLLVNAENQQWKRLSRDSSIAPLQWVEQGRLLVDKTKENLIAIMSIGSD
jgi:hypothetical protein